jgi:broad specificity phosphatase PhoE
MLLLIRHGETRWNFEGRLQGRFDSPLTDRGVAQAEAFGRTLRSLPDFASAEVVASPLGRARRTAEIICSGGPVSSFRTEDRLREISLGSWDGLTREELNALRPGIFDGDSRYEWFFRSPGGEAYDTFAARIGAWLSQTDPSQPTVVVTHGIVSRVLRGIYAGLPRNIAISLPTPQDKIFLLSGGTIGEIPVLLGIPKNDHCN